MSVTEPASYVPLNIGDRADGTDWVPLENGISDSLTELTCTDASATKKYGTCWVFSHFVFVFACNCHRIVGDVSFQKICSQMGWQWSFDDL